MPATPVLLVDVLNASTAHVGLLAAIGGAAGLVGNCCWGRLVDRRPSLRVLRAIALNRTPGYHFPGNFVDLSFERVSSESTRLSYEAGEEDIGSLAVAADHWLDTRSCS